MPSPTEHQTVQARILAHAQEIGWTYVPRAEAERRRGFDGNGGGAEERARRASLYFGDLLHAMIRRFNPLYKEAEGALIGQWQRLPANIEGNRETMKLSNAGCPRDPRERWSAYARSTMVVRHDWRIKNAGSSAKDSCPALSNQPRSG